MKKQLVLACAAAAALCLPAGASAQSGSRVEKVFECSLRNGKTVSVTAQGDHMSYRYGTPRRAELRLSGTPSSGNVFHFLGRYYNILHQLRFQNGRYSYIVYSLPGSRVADAKGRYGVMVLRDGRPISDTQCRREMEFQGGFALFDRLPQDDERYNVMALEE